MADLFVVTWFRRHPRGPRGSYDTGWELGRAAFTGQREAVARWKAEVAELEAHAGQGYEDRKTGRRPPDQVDSDRRVSHVHATAYTLDGRASLEVLAAILTDPPAFDPVASSGTWFTEARVIRHYSGIRESNRRRREAVIQLEDRRELRTA